MKNSVISWLDTIKSGRRSLNVWGTGSSAADFLEAYRDIPVRSFVESRPKKTMFRGIPCVSPETLDPDIDCIIIASEFYEEIERQLMGLGFATDRFVRHSQLMMDDADSILVSYQKCGRTWLRVLLGRYFQKREGIDESDILKITASGFAFRNKHPEMPILFPHHDDNAHRKTAEELTHDKEYYRSKPILFMCRDPRDVVVSNFYHMRYRAGSYKGPIDSFARQYFESIVAFFNIWAVQNISQFLLVRYEDLLKDTENELRRLLRFVAPGYPIIESALHDTIEYASLENMRTYEKTNRFRTQSLSNKNDDPRSAKIRKGKTGGFRKELSTDVVKWCDRIIESELNPVYGYSSRACAE